MNKYVVAFISFHDNVLTQEIIEAESEFAAMIAKLGSHLTYGKESTVEDLKQYAFDCDSMISAFKI